MRHLIIVIVGITLLTGCHHLNIRDFERSDHVSTENNRAGFTIYTKSSAPPNVEGLLAAEINSSDELKKKLDKYCRDDKKLAPALIPVVTAFGKYVYDSYMDKQSKNAKDLKKAATSTYSETIHIDSSKFKEQKCAIVYRANTDEKAIKFLAVLRFKNYGAAFAFSPIYVRAKDTSAVTKKAAEGEFAKINASIAVSIKAVGQQENSLPKLEEIGSSVVTVQNVEIGPNAPATKCDKDCVKSDLIPYLRGSNQIISMSVAVTEMGKLGVDIDEEVAEYEALKEAFGDSIAEAIKFRLDELYGSD